jgi:predicted nuclease with TOPRIM domain
MVQRVANADMSGSEAFAKFLVIINDSIGYVTRGYVHIHHQARQIDMLDIAKSEIRNDVLHDDVQGNVLNSECGCHY